MDIRTELDIGIKAGCSHFYIYSKQLDRTVSVVQEALMALKSEEQDFADFDLVFWELAPSFRGGKIIPKDGLQDLMIMGEIPKKQFMVMLNYDWFLDKVNGPFSKNSLDVIAYIQSNVVKWRTPQNRKVFIIISSKDPRSGIPSDLEPYFIVLRHALPGRDEILGVYNYVVESVGSGTKGVALEQNELDNLIESSLGMPLQQIEDAYSRSLVQEKKLSPTFVSKARAEMLEFVHGIRLIEPDKLDNVDILGYDIAKQKILSSISSPLAKGVLLVGPPGCGKTALTEHIVRETGIPAVDIEFANLIGSLLGESYERMQSVIDLIKAFGKCIVRADEIEKGMAGVSKDGGTTGTEVTIRMMGMWLKFMSDPNRECYIIATCNDISAFEGAPEYLRAERWDFPPFFIDLPGEHEKAAILNYYKTKYDWTRNGKIKVHKIKGYPDDMSGWSPAEIRAACRISAMTGEPLEVTSKDVIPIEKIQGGKIVQLREWAKIGAIAASADVAKQKGSKGPRDIRMGVRSKAH